MKICIRYEMEGIGELNFVKLKEMGHLKVDNNVAIISSVYYNVNIINGDTIKIVADLIRCDEYAFDKFRAMIDEIVTQVRLTNAKLIFFKTWKNRFVSMIIHNLLEKYKEKIKEYDDKIIIQMN